MVAVEMLISEASKTADGMLKFTSGKDPKEPARSDVRSFAAIGNLLKTMAETSRSQHTMAVDLTRAMERIANLKVRSAAELIERGDWKKLVGELQAIAQETLGQKKTMASS